MLCKLRMLGLPSSLDPAYSALPQNSVFHPSSCANKSIAGPLSLLHGILPE